MSFSMPVVFGVSVLSAFIAWLITGQNPSLGHEAAGSQSCSRESWLGMIWLGVQGLVLGIKGMDQHVSPPSARPPVTCRFWKSLWWWEELNLVLEVSGFRGDSRAEAVPALWSWEELRGLHGPMSAVDLWGLFGDHGGCRLDQWGLSVFHGGQSKGRTVGTTMVTL